MWIDACIKLAAIRHTIFLVRVISLVRDRGQDCWCRGNDMFFLYWSLMCALSYRYLFGAAFIVWRRGVGAVSTGNVMTLVLMTGTME